MIIKPVKKDYEFIVESLLDTDFYKFTMGQWFHKHSRFGKAIVDYQSKNRTIEVKLVDTIDEAELRKQLDHVLTLRFTQEELDYLASHRISKGRTFSDDYLHHLSQLVPCGYTLEIVDGQYVITFTGPGDTVTYSEIPGLEILAELHAKALMRKLSEEERQDVMADALMRRLIDKVELLQQYPDLIFTDFGTRRRAFRWWQDFVVGYLSQAMPTQFMGTSNVLLAKKHGIKPIGTMAHELFMVAAAVMGDTDEELLQVQDYILDTWWDMYGEDLAIYLPDTFGSDYFFRTMTDEQAKRFKGGRHDSGLPKEYGEKQNAFYESKGIDPKSKICVFSDGLKAPKMVDIHTCFEGIIAATPFGIGTNLTNDLSIPSALSLVIKTVRANGRSCVKLSDNLAKAIGDPQEVERYKRVFGYTRSFTEKCEY